jgi:hypothetical protein
VRDSSKFIAALVTGIIVLFVVFAIGAVRGDETPNPFDPALASGVVGIMVDKKPQLFIFISKTGKRMVTYFDECKQDKKCSELVHALSAAHLADVINLTDDVCPTDKGSQDESKFLMWQF